MGVASACRLRVIDSLFASATQSDRDLPRGQGAEPVDLWAGQTVDRANYKSDCELR